jgi:ubiquinone/menaquinone biosynthesis C-methylase UbiE
MTENEAVSCCTVRDRRFPAFLMDNFVRRIVFPPEKLVSQFIMEGKAVADLGSGPGYFTLPIAKTVGQKGKVYAVDFDAKQIERLKKKAAREGYEETIEAHASSAAEIGFIPDKGVDFVFASGLLCCMVDHAGAIREIKRILKEDGSAYLSVSRIMRKKDPRAVTQAEWREIISGNFKIVREGQRLTSRWAEVSLSDRNGRDTESIQRAEPVPSSQPACCSP